MASKTTADLSLGFKRVAKFDAIENLRYVL